MTHQRFLTKSYASKASPWSTRLTLPATWTFPLTAHAPRKMSIDQYPREGCKQICATRLIEHKDPSIVDNTYTLLCRSLIQMKQTPTNFGERDDLHCATEMLKLVDICHGLLQRLLIAVHADTRRRLVIVAHTNPKR